MIHLDDISFLDLEGRWKIFFVGLLLVCLRQTDTALTALFDNFDRIFEMTKSSDATAKDSISVTFFWKNKLVRFASKGDLNDRKYRISFVFPLYVIIPDVT